MIHIIGDWYIDVDQYSYTLEEYAGTSVDKDGVERKNYKNQTYHATLEKALKHFGRVILTEKLSEKDMELSEAIEIVKDCNERMHAEITRLMNIGSGE